MLFFFVIGIQPVKPLLQRLDFLIIGTLAYRYTDRPVPITEPALYFKNLTHGLLV